MSHRLLSTTPILGWTADLLRAGQPCGNDLQSCRHRCRAPASGAGSPRGQRPPRPCPVQPTPGLPSSGRGPCDQPVHRRGRRPGVAPRRCREAARPPRGPRPRDRGRRLPAAGPGAGQPRLAASPHEAPPWSAGRGAAPDALRQHLLRVGAQRSGLVVVPAHPDSLGTRAAGSNTAHRVADAVARRPTPAIAPGTRRPIGDAANCTPVSAEYRTPRRQSPVARSRCWATYQWPSSWKTGTAAAGMGRPLDGRRDRRG